MITRLEIYALVAALALTGALYVLHLQHRVDDLKGQVATATAQGGLNQTGAEINDRRATNTAKIHRQAEEGRDAVQNATDLDATLAGYGAAVDGVRAAGREPVAAPH